MTRNEFMEFLKTDPIFKASDKQLVATLYESPFDNVVTDEEAGTITVTYKGESFILASDDPDYVNVYEENPYIEMLILSKRVIISAGFREDGGDYLIVANDADITETAIVPFPAPADDEGGDDDDNGGIH